MDKIDLPQVNNSSFKYRCVPVVSRDYSRWIELLGNRVGNELIFGVAVVHELRLPPIIRRTVRFYFIIVRYPSGIKNTFDPDE